MLKGKFQWRLELGIKAKQTEIWEIADDIALIPEYHPEVGKVTFIDGKYKRAVGVKYQCNILEGRKGSCIEEVVEYIPNYKLSTRMGKDTWGMDKMFKDFVVETTLLPNNESTILRFEAFYNPVGIFYKILNILFLRRVIKKRSLLVMKGIKNLSENRIIKEN